MINITNAELFKDLSNIEWGEKNYDLHNDYDCVSISYSYKEKVMKFLFQSQRDNKNIIALYFENAIMAEFNLNFTRTIDSATLDSFYRGRFEFNGDLLEYSSLGQAYFYVEFEEGDKFEILSSNAIFELQDQIV